VTRSIRVGTSGWLYPPWRGTFYPKGLVHRRELEYLSSTLTSVEINGTFYSLQKPDSFRRWAAETPDDFVFAVKGPRFVTHMKKLRDVDTPVANFLASGVLALGPKLGPILWQLPPTMRFDPDLLGPFLDNLPRTTAAAADLARRHDQRLDGRDWLEIDEDRPLRHAVEVRHPSFATPQLISLLRDQNVALVLADAAHLYPVIDEQTADFTYCRLHGDEKLYVSGYSDESLDNWATTLRRHTGDIHVYFDNDVKVHAPFDARGLLDRLS
jgi:uncharacterized protein YecE (DUF72 family)